MRANLRMDSNIFVRAMKRLEPTRHLRAGVGMEPVYKMRAEEAMQPIFPVRADVLVEPIYAMRASIRMEPTRPLRARYRMQSSEGMRATEHLEPDIFLRAGILVNPVAHVRATIRVDPTMMLRAEWTVQPKLFVRLCYDSVMEKNHITADEYRRRVLNSMTEKHWQERVMRLLAVNGWVAYHTFDSKRSAPGFPDIVAVNADREIVLFAELKTMRGKLTTPQKLWISVLKTVAHATPDHVVVEVWRPDQYSDVLAFAGGTEPL